MKNIVELLKKFNIKTNNVSLYEMAFTHSSFNADANTKHHDYERLEFLGDSVLGCVVSELSYKSRSDLDQGNLTKLKSSLVNTHSLADFAREYHFEDYVRVGNSFSRNVKECDNILEDVFEAFVGAMFLDKGFVIVRKFLISTLYRDIQKFHLEDLHDYKSKLQEAMQGEHRESVTYQIVKESGPSHNKHFVANALFDGSVIGVGEGTSKKAAEQMAAKSALDKMVTK